MRSRLAIGASDARALDPKISGGPYAGDGDALTCSKSSVCPFQTSLRRGALEYLESYLAPIPGCVAAQKRSVQEGALGLTSVQQACVHGPGDPTRYLVAVPYRTGFFSMSGTVVCGGSRRSRSRQERVFARWGVAVGSRIPPQHATMLGRLSTRRAAVW